MKKIIGSISLIVAVMVLFFNTNQANDPNSDLADLVSLNSANADCGPPPPCSSVCHSNSRFYCILTCPGAPPVSCANSYPNDPQQ